MKDRNRFYGRLLWMITIVTLLIGGTAYAVRVSGPGQSTKSASLSVAIASDQIGGDAGVSNATNQKAPDKLTAVTPSDSTDTSSYCNRGVYVGHDAGNSNIQLLGSSETDAAAAVTFRAVPNGTFIPGDFKRVMADASTSNGAVCLGK